MQLPVDVTALVAEVTDIQAAQTTEVSVSVYVDNKAPADVVAHVRSRFASVLPTVRMTLSYLDSTFEPHPEDDMAIIVAGGSQAIGAAAAALRAVGVPVMIVTTQPMLVNHLAMTNGHAIPEGDTLAPQGADESSEPVALDDSAAASLDERMGAWVVTTCREKRLALALAFPFMRRPLAAETVQLTSIQNAGIGVVPLIPGADLPLITLNQAKMVLQIAAEYGQEMGFERLKELAAVVGGAYLCRTLARHLLEFVPVLGFAIRGVIAYGGTSILGYAIVEYFEGGQNVTGVVSAASSLGEKGTGLAAKAKGIVSEYAPAVSDKVAKVAPVVNKALETMVGVSREQPAKQAD